jgi:glutathione synthase/RimK-type ligase-like ATP-grasp enzyme
MKQQFRNIISDAAKELSIGIKFFSDGWCAELNYNNVIRHIIGNTLPINNVSVYRIVRNKNICFDILKNGNISATPHISILSPLSRLNRGSKESLSECISKVIEEYDFPLVVKRNETSSGNGVFITNNKVELENTLNKLFSYNNVITISPFRKIKSEFRVVILNGESLLCYEKIRPFVTGDGNSSLIQLIEAKFNKYTGMANLELVDPSLNPSLFVIPDKGEIVYLQDKHNSFTSSTCATINSNELNLLAINAAKFVGAKFVTVDIIYSENNGYEVLEINASVVLNLFANLSNENYYQVKNIFKKALISIFSET